MFIDKSPCVRYETLLFADLLFSMKLININIILTNQNTEFNRTVQGSLFVTYILHTCDVI